MLPCFLMTAAYFVYRAASRREYEYTLEDGVFRIERVSDRGRRVLHEISFADVELVCLPDAPEAQPYKKKGGTVRLPKKDYTSYREGVPYYTVIATEEGKKMKFLLDLTSEAVARLRRRCHDAVRIPGSAG